MAVARGNAQAFSADKNLKADVIVAYFKKNKAGKSSIHRLEAFDNVKIKTATEHAASDRGIYNVKSGIATLTGSVMIVRDGNQIDGCKAEVNMNTGISKMFSCAGQGGGALWDVGVYPVTQAVALVGKQHVEAGQRSVASGDVAL